MLHKKPILSVDFGGTTVKYLVIAKGKEIASSITNSSRILDSHYAAARDVVEKFKHFTSKCGSIAGIAISFNSPVKNKTWVRWGKIEGKWTYKNFKTILQQAGIVRNIPIVIINDAKSALYAEAKIGAAKGHQNAVMLTFGSAIGGAALIEGKLVNGKSALGAELSNLIVNFNGVNFDNLQLACYYASMRSLENNYYQSTKLVKTGKEIFELYDKGNKDAHFGVTSLYKSIAVVVFNCVYAYGPEVVVIGGGLSNRDESLNEIKKELALLETTLQLDIDTNVKLAKVKNKAGNFGAYFFLLDKLAN